MDPKVPLRKRTTPMQVLVLGLCRTGTASMKQGLQELGYENVYHMDTIDKDPTHRELWDAAVRAKYDNTNPQTLGVEELDHLLGEYDAVTDIPAALFVTELIAAYPEAKIILTTRDPIKWKASMKDTVIASFTDPWRKVALMLRIPGVRKPASGIMEFVFRNFDRYGIQALKEHNDLVRRTAPKERFLEFEVGRDGFEILAPFLGKEVPTIVDENGEKKVKDFPRTNDKEAFVKSLDGAYRRIVLRHVAKVTLATAGVVAAGMILNSSIKGRRT